ncbi:tyrosine-type recombinase/integrase [Nonomuraea dietziae]|uniref:tyrosine-type recombinase/integrase n=1 Tax=Nonomuraea dietziae TaxID=65515 RepID=UPI0033C4E386
MPDGSPIDTGDDWNEWKAILKEAEINKDARVHDARHTVATLLLELGVDLRVVQAILGPRRSAIRTSRKPSRRRRRRGWVALSGRRDCNPYCNPGLIPRSRKRESPGHVR